LSFSKSLSSATSQLTTFGVDVSSISVVISYLGGLAFL
jgi:hypothetical protein